MARKPEVKPESSTEENIPTEESSETMSDVPSFLSGSDDNNTPPASFDGVPSFLSDANNSGGNPFGGFGGNAAANVDYGLSEDENIFDVTDVSKEIVDPFAPILPGMYLFRISAATPKKNPETKVLSIEVTATIKAGKENQIGRAYKMWIVLPSKDVDRTPDQVETLKNRIRFYFDKFGLNEAEVLSFNLKSVQRLLINREFYGQINNVPARDRDNNLTGRQKADMVKLFSVEEANKGMSQFSRSGPGASF